MAKISLIGAGSLVFTRNLCSDILLAPVLQDCTLSLMDIDPARLRMARQLVEGLVAQRGLSARVEATTDRREAVRGADYVITTFQQGGLDAYALDIEIPRRYGVEQCVGDTLGPGGVFRALRSIPVLLGLCQEMDEAAPDALLINYVNPMAANCWAVAAGSGRPHLGLCHSVQGTSQMLAEWLEVPYPELRFRCAGINHQAFFLELRRGAEDLYPRLRQAVEREDIHGREPVRVDLMRHFGYFVTESSGHASEYLPYFRKDAGMVEEVLAPQFKSPGDDWLDWGRTGGYLRHCRKVWRQFEADFESILRRPAPTTRSHEYGAQVIESIETGEPAVIYGNVPNEHLVDNLPPGCCVEVACLVDRNGIQPAPAGALPPQLAALNRTNINVQELIVEAAVHRRRDAVYHAVKLDPLTAAVLTLPQIDAMVTELLEAQEAWVEVV